MRSKASSPCHQEEIAPWRDGALRHIANQPQWNTNEILDQKCYMALRLFARLELGRQTHAKCQSWLHNLIVSASPSVLHSALDVYLPRLHLPWGALPPFCRPTLTLPLPPHLSLRLVGLDPSLSKSGGPYPVNRCSGPGCITWLHVGGKP